MGSPRLVEPATDRDHPDLSTPRVGDLPVVGRAGRGPRTLKGLGRGAGPQTQPPAVLCLRRAAPVRGPRADRPTPDPAPTPCGAAVQAPQAEPPQAPRRRDLGGASAR